MFRFIKFIAAVIFSLALFIAVETAVTVIRPHKSVEAERYEKNRELLTEDRAVLQSFIIAQGS